MLNLHTHSEFSYRDAISSPADIAHWHKEHGINSFCITDHGVITSFPEAFRVADKEEMKFIPGCEFYLKPEDKHDMQLWVKMLGDANKILKRKTATAEEKTQAEKIKERKEFFNPRKYHHVTVIAINETGLNNLINLMNVSKLYYKPRITRQELLKYNEGLIVMSGCIAGELAYYIQNHAEKHAREIAREYKEAMGDRFYIELQYHGLELYDWQVERNYPSELEVFNTLIKIGKEEGIPFIATNDSHYINPEDDELRTLYVDIKRNKTEDDIFQMEELVNGYHLIQEDEIRKVFPFDSDVIEEAIENTKKIDEICEHIPGFPKGEPLIEKSNELYEACVKGWEKRRKGTKYEQESWDRFNYEFGVIKDKNFCEYFINIVTITDKAADLNIKLGSSRGSAGGSEILYLLGCSDTDPLKYGLIFERFMNPDRNDFPDVDLDFASYWVGKPKDENDEFNSLYPLKEIDERRRNSDFETYEQNGMVYYRK